MNERSRKRETTLFAAVTLVAFSIMASRATGQITVSQESGGTVNRIELRSRVLNEKREVRVSVPRTYDSSSISYPLLVTLDGEASFEHTASIAHYLARSGAMPEMIVAAVVNTDRERDYTPPGIRMSRPNPGGDEFLDFIEAELMPALNAKYRIGGPTTLIGHSSGGIIASYALATRPNLFDAVIVLDAPFHLDDDWLVHRLLRRAHQHADKPLRLIVAETRFTFDDQRWADLSNNRPTGSILSRFAVENESHQSMAFQGAYRGLKRLFASYAQVEPADTTLSAVKQAYHVLNATYGAAVHPPIAAYVKAIEDCLLMVRADDANALLDAMRAAYGDSRRTTALAARIDAAREQVGLDETVADMVAAPKATADQIRPFVGRWRGVMQSDGGAPLDLSFILRVEDGSATGEAHFHRPDGSTDRLDLIVIRLRGESLELGYMNQMHPRGVLLNALRWDDTINPTTLEGVMTIVGVKWEPPPGMKIPRTTVRLMRADDDPPRGAQMSMGLQQG